MENNEQNNFEATNNVNPVNNVEPTPTVESTPEVKTEDTIMVAEPAVRPAVEPTPAPVAPASQPMPAPEVSSRPEPVVETTPVEPTVEPKPVVIPKGEKPKGNNKGVVTLLLILILIVLAVCGYFVYDKYVKDLITKPSTNETANNNQANNNVPEPTNDEGIFGELAVKNQKLEYEDSKSKSYTFDIYLDDKMVVEGLVYGEAGGNAGQISLNKMGYLKDTVIDAKYLAFFVKHAPGAHVPSTLFIIDKDGKIVFQRKGTSDGQYKIEETGEYAGGTTYKLDEDANRVLYYVISDSIEERSVQISSGSPVDETYKTYAKNTNVNETTNNNQNNSSNEDQVLYYDEISINDLSIGEKIIVKNKQIISEDATKGGKKYTYDLYLDDKLVAENLEYYEDEGYNSGGKILQDYHKVGIIKDVVTDAKYFAFKLYAAPTKYATIKLFVIDKDGKIVFKRESRSEGQYEIKEIGEYVGTTTYKIDDDTNTMYYYDIPDYSLIKIEKKSVQISSGTAVDTLVKTYTKDDLN